MLTTLRRVLSFEMTIAEWIGTAVMVVAPYLAIGVLWALVDSGGVAAVVWWPAQVVSTACLA
jgi:hypothetical protein